MATSLTGAAALAAVADVRRRCRLAGEPDPLDEAADLRVRHHDLGEAWVTADGFAMRAAGGLDLAVAPACRRAGLGRRLAEDACRRAGELTAWSHGDSPAARALASRLGFEAVRELWVMRRRSSELPPVEIPADVTIRHFTDGDADALLAVNAAAFADHPEQGALDLDGLRQRMAEPWFDPADLLLAVADDGTLLGFHWTKRHDERHGEVYVVGVSPAAQGRGLGRVLTVAGLHHLAERGIGEVLLYVESDNDPARRLYSSLGFGHAAADTHVQYRRVCSDVSSEVGRSPARVRSEPGPISSGGTGPTSVLALFP
ncbi:MAG: mycothiol synthase [Nocardioidaceae bacterium]|nr:mycothiol synthase [Nocardioidaceae bacterium]